MNTTVLTSPREFYESSNATRNAFEKPIKKIHRESVYLEEMVDVRVFKALAKQL